MDKKLYKLAKELNVLEPHVKWGEYINDDKLHIRLELFSENTSLGVVKYYANPDYSPIREETWETFIRPYFEDIINRYSNRIKRSELLDYNLDVKIDSLYYGPTKCKSDHPTNYIDGSISVTFDIDGKKYHRWGVDLEYLYFETLKEHLNV